LDSAHRYNALHMGPCSQVRMLQRPKFLANSHGALKVHLTILATKQSDSKL
jgi:hypothetical protein